MTITKGDMHTWKFQTPSTTTLGITDAKAYELRKENSNHWSFYCDDAYGIDTGFGTKYGNVLALGGQDYAKTCGNNEVISMTLDMTGEKFATLSFKVDEDYGVAMDDIDLSKEYRMIVDLYGDDQIKLLQ